MCDCYHACAPRSRYGLRCLRTCRANIACQQYCNFFVKKSGAFLVCASKAGNGGIKATDLSLQTVYFILTPPYSVQNLLCFLGALKLDIMFSGQFIIGLLAISDLVFSFSTIFSKHYQHFQIVDPRSV